METITIKTRIYLKSGQEIVVYLNEITTKPSPPKAVISEITWKNTSETLPCLFRINPDEIAAIVIVTEKTDV